MKTLTLYMKAMHVLARYCYRSVNCCCQWFGGGMLMSTAYMFCSDWIVVGMYLLQASLAGFQIMLQANVAAL